jgi:D-allose transport system substrate-binding protein
MKSRFLAMSFVLALILGTVTVFAASNSFLSPNAYLKQGAFITNVPKPHKAYKIANISRTLLNEHWVKNKEGFEAALRHYGLTGQVFAVQSEQDVMEQANILQTVISKGYDAIIVSPISEQNLLPGLAEATKRGIVIINVDTAEITKKSASDNNIKISSYIGSDNYDAGVMAAKYFANALKSVKKAKVGVVRGRPADTCAIDRSDGFVQTVKKMRNLVLAGDQSGMWDRLKSLDVTTNMLRANPDLKAIYYNNDTMVLGGIEAAINLGYKVLTEAEVKKGKLKAKKTIALIGNDGVPEAIQKVKDGELTGTIAQKPYLMGYAAVEASIQALEGKTPAPVIHTPIKIIFKSDF